jgi:hypothetical protein
MHALSRMIPACSRDSCQAVLATLAIATLIASEPAGAAGIPSSKIPIPAGAAEVDRNDEIQMITYRSALEPAQVQDFYKKELAKLGWTMDEEDSFMIEGVGSLTFAKGDEAFRIAIQDGRPKSRTRMIVMGEGVAWAPSEWEELGDAEKPPEEVETGELVADGDHELPVPEGCESIGTSGTPFRRTLDAQIRRPLGDVVAFYRRELPAGGWTKVLGEKETPGEKLTLDVDGTRGPLRVEIRRKRKDTLITLTTRDSAAARKAGVLPEPGKARLLLGNTHEVDATITVDDKDHAVAAGTGAADPAAALSLSLPPGDHKVTIKIPGETDQTEVVTLGADETWAVMVLSTGGYLAERAY